MELVFGNKWTYSFTLIVSLVMLNDLMFLKQAQPNTLVSLCPSSRDWYWYSIQCQISMLNRKKYFIV